MLLFENINVLFNLRFVKFVVEFWELMLLLVKVYLGNVVGLIVVVILNDSIWLVGIVIVFG